MSIAGGVSRNRILNMLVFFPIDHVIVLFSRVIIYGYLPIEANSYFIIFPALTAGYFAYTSSGIALAALGGYMVACFVYFLFNEKRYKLSFGIASFLFSDRWDKKPLFFTYLLVIFIALAIALVRIII